MFMIDLGVQSDYSILGVSPSADAREIRASQTKIFGQLDRQRTTSMRNEEERRKIEEKQANINRIGDKLSNPVERTKYDRQNVHLTFFTIRRTSAAVWGERGLLLRWMHASVRDFLLTQGARVPPMTDLEGRDFSADFTENPLLEELLQREDRGAP